MPIAELPRPANPGEQILQGGESARYLRTNLSGWGYNPYDGYLWITSQRLIFAGRFMRSRLAVAFPLRRISAASILRMRVQFAQADVLKIEFENGGKEYFVPQVAAVSEWLATLDSARVGAPDLPYEVEPVLRSGVEGSIGRSWLILGAVVVGLCLCALAACAMLYLIQPLLGR